MSSNATLCADLGLAGTTPNPDAVQPSSVSLRQLRSPWTPTTNRDDELLDPSDIEAEGGPTIKTQYTWASTGRHGWDRLIIKVGNRNKIRREAWRKWQQQHARSDAF